MPCGLRFEKLLWSKGVSLVAGIDEAGRGPLAGPVVAAVAVLPTKFSLAGLNDSKQLAEEFREELFEALTASGALVCYGVGIAEPAEVDRFNILRATFLAMQRAIAALPIQPEHLLIDGLPVPVFQQPQTAIVGGDGKSKSIAAASVIAKVTRDRMMRKWHSEFPQYSFDRNKGYGTREHLESLQIHGPCPIHRRSFAPVSQPYFIFH
ncbi:MAG TPA: ribonuclease HII [Chthoniobacterales bacterium]|jgi:ribonuclease HII|nr:ribonuclease HII [Chthoniobacterales bacterium]